MSNTLLQAGADALGLALIVVACVAALAALAARSLFAMCVGLAAAAALAACAMLALGEGEGGLALALAGVGVIPVFLLAGLLLSARASKARPPPLTSLAIAAASVVAIAWVSPELQQAPAPATEDGATSALWFAALLFVAVSVCAGLLGYGERGLLEHKRDGLK